MSQAGCHAETLTADAVAITTCADRLRTLAEALRANDAAPPWLPELLDAHIAACTVAAADLTDAAARLLDLR
jgi:hypothetical protein